MSLAYRDHKIQDSLISRWDPRWKLAGILLLGVSASLLNHPGTAAAAAGTSLVLACVAKIPGSWIWGRAGLVGLAVLPVMIILPLTAPSSSPGSDIWWFHFGFAEAIITITILFRALALGWLALIVVRTTPMPVTIAAAHKLGLPGLLIQIVQLAFRYIQVFFDEIRRMRVALRTRGFRPAATTTTYRTTGHVVGSLLVRGGDRAERVADAMRCRGFSGKNHSLHQFQTRLGDVLGTVALVLGSTLLLLGEYLQVWSVPHE